MNISMKVTQSDMFFMQKVRNGFFRINDAFGEANINGKDFDLQSLHIKSPSEHAIMGGMFPAELQIRGKSSDGINVSFVILVELGPKSKLFENMGFGSGDYKDLDVTGWNGEGDLRMNIINLERFKNDKFFIYYEGAETEKPNCDKRHYYVSVDTITMDTD